MHRRNFDPTRHSLLALAFAATLPAAAGAQAPDSTRPPILDPVVVTGTLAPTRARDATQPIVVLSGHALRERGLTTVADALREIPGATIVRSGSYGGVTSLFLRGGESRYTKVLVDGVPVNSVGGAIALEDLTLDDVDRIEVAYGPASALYGADAVAGVIQIFTSRGDSRPGLSASARAGSYGSRDASLALRSGRGPIAGSVGAGWHSTDGILPFNNAYRNGTIAAGLDAAPDRATRIRLTGRYGTAEYHYPTDYAGAVVDSNSYDVRHRLVASVDVARTITPWLTIRALGGADELRRLSEDTRRDSAAFVKSSAPAWNRRRFGEGRVELDAAGVRAIAGAQYQRESARTDFVTRRYTTSYAGATVTRVDGPVAYRITHGYYATAQRAVGRIALLDASVRYDDHSDYHGATTARGGISVRPWTAAHVRASYGSAFNAPPFYATQGSAYNRPNPSLRPERAHTLDLALEQELLDGRVSVTAGWFDQRFAEMIQYVPAVYDASFNVVAPAYFDNLTGARSRGVDLRASLAPARAVFATASYTITSAVVTRTAPGYAGAQRPGDALLRRPTHQGSATVTFAPGGWSLSATTTYTGRRPDMDFSQYPSPVVTLPAYTLLNLAASADVLHSRAGTIAATARADNVLDRRYQEVFNFAAPRRAVFVGLRLAPPR